MGLDYTKNKQAFGQSKQSTSAYGKDYERQSSRNYRRMMERKNKQPPLTIAQRNAKELYHKMLSAYEQRVTIPEIKFVELNEEYSFSFTFYQDGFKAHTQYEFVLYKENRSWDGVIEIVIRHNGVTMEVSQAAFKPCKPTEEDVIMYVMRKEIK